MFYDHQSIEKKWQKFWEENQTYKTENKSDKPKFYVLDMFPYPSGAGLHVGHPLGYIASDIYARFKRHQGFNVLHPIGYDSFGLPAEQYAIQTGQHPAITTEQNITRYEEQLRRIGFSFDWSREVRTSDAEYYKWTQWIFIELFHSWYNKTTDKAEPISSLIHHFEKFGTENINAVQNDELNFTADEWNSADEIEKQDILLSFNETKLNISGEEILRNNMDKVDEAYHRLIDRNEILKQKYGASLFGLGKELEKEWFVDKIKDGICFGLSKALEKFFTRYSNPTDEQINQYLTNEGLTDSILYQMFHLLFTNVPLSGIADKFPKTLLREINSYMVLYPNSSNPNFLSKRENIANIRSKVLDFSDKLDEQNLESFNVIFYPQINPSLKNSEGKNYSSHIIHVQRDRVKGFRFFDQFIEKSFQIRYRLTFIGFNIQHESF